MTLKLLLPILVVVLTQSCSGEDEFWYNNICPESECNCAPPKNVSAIEAKNVEIQKRGNCQCVCGKKRFESCVVDADCIRGFTCSSSKICICPCDDQRSPFCPSRFSKCDMDGETPKCACRARFECSHAVRLPVCVLWANGTVDEYRNKCAFVRRICSMSREHDQYNQRPTNCRSVKNLHFPNQAVQWDYTDFWSRYENVNGSAIYARESAKSASHHNYYTPFVYPEPEPVPEVEPEPLILSKISGS